MNLLIDYIRSLTHLYGLVHKDKVVEIYNAQNREKINIAVVEKLMQEPPQEFEWSYVIVRGDYFINESILDFGSFEEQLELREGKPFYIPSKKELLLYKDPQYFEVTKEYLSLLEYVTNAFYNGDEFSADILCDDIQVNCEIGFSVQNIIYEFNRRNIEFKDEKQVNEVMEYVMDLANNTRLAENNGHTPKELSDLRDKPNLHSLPSNTLYVNNKVGRNDPCPCGSGKKYKKCCLGKV